MKTIVRYYGGKARIAKQVIPYFPRHHTYVEAFGGGASVLLNKSRSTIEVYNDLDGEIVNLFRVLRDPVQARELERVCRFTPYARAEYDLSALSTGDPIEQARRTLVSAWFSHGGAAGRSSGGRGGFRHRRTAQFRQPSGEWKDYPDNIAAFCQRLQGVVIENRPAVWVIQKFDSPATLHYIDPPYVPETRNMERRYKHEMTREEHRDLAHLLYSVKGMVVVSGYPSALYDELYGEWCRVNIAARAENNDKRTECLWLSPSCDIAGLQQSFSLEDL